MKVFAMGPLTLFLCIVSIAQIPSKSVTVPVTLDHNRIVIDVYVPLKDGGTKRVRGLVDTGRSELLISSRVAKMQDEKFSCKTGWCKAVAPESVLIGGMKISLAGAGGAKAPARPSDFSDVLFPGMSPEVIVPSNILKNYDIVIDYANREFTIGPPGSVKFSGAPTPIKISSNGFLAVSCKVKGQEIRFGIDTALSATLVAPVLFADWRKKQPTWPHIEGVLGAGNMTGSSAEVKAEMTRLSTMQVGASTLMDALVESNQDALHEYAGAPGEPVVGLLGGEAFKGTRVGVDYVHSSLYVESVTSSKVAGLDVVGLTLRPEVDGSYTVVAVIPFEGHPAVADVRVGDVLVGVDGAPVTGATMGQVWSLLGGDPGQIRKLIVERDGKRVTVEAPVRRFLGTKAN